MRSQHDFRALGFLRLEGGKGDGQFVDLRQMLFSRWVGVGHLGFSSGLRMLQLGFWWMRGGFWRLAALRFEVVFLLGSRGAH